MKSEPHAERLALLLTVIDLLKRTKRRFTSQYSANHLRDGDAAAIDLVLEAWLAVLEDEEIFVGFEESAKNPIGDATIHWVTAEVLERVDSLLTALDRTLDKGGILPFVRRYISDLADELASVILTGKGFAHQGQRGERHLQQLSHVEDLLRQFDSGIFVRVSERTAIKAAERTQKAAERTQDIATKASKAAGITGETVMSQHYESLANNESETARRFRFWTIVSSVFGGVTAAVFVLGPTFGWAAVNIEPGDWVHLVQRAIVTAAVFAFSAYLARQSHQHRTMANWAGSLAVQLKTFEAFLAPITSEDVRDRLRTSFAERVFGEHPVLKGEPSGTGTADVAEKALDILAKNSAK